MMLSLERIVIDGLLASLAFTALVVGSLLYNKRVWLQDYPKALQALVPPLTAHEKRQQMVLMVPLLFIFLGIPYLSAAAFAGSIGESVTFLQVFIHTFVVMNIVNLVDAFVIDYLILVVFFPKLAILPGTEGALHLYQNITGKLVTDYFKGLVFCTVGSVIISGIVMVL